MQPTLHHLIAPICTYLYYLITPMACKAQLIYKIQPVPGAQPVPKAQTVRKPQSLEDILCEFGPIKDVSYKLFEVEPKRVVQALLLPFQPYLTYTTISPCFYLQPLLNHHYEYQLIHKHKETLYNRGRIARMD